MGTYYVLTRLNPDAERLREMQQARVTTQLVTEELRMDRTVGGVSHEAPTRSASMLRLRAATLTAGDGGAGGALALARIERLEVELRRMASEMDVVKAHVAELRGAAARAGAEGKSD